VQGQVCNVYVINLLVMSGIQIAAEMCTLSELKQPLHFCNVNKL